VPECIGEKTCKKPVQLHNSKAKALNDY